VVDNASADESAELAEAVAERSPRVRLLRSPTNRGYAGAVNLARSSRRGAPTSPSSTWTSWSTRAGSGR
jgi:GT2 family glycosyltransferase